MDQQRQVIIVSENSYHRAVFRETLIEAGFWVNDQVTADDLEEYLRGAPETNLLLLDRDLVQVKAEQLLRQVRASGATPPGLRCVCLVSRPVGSGDLEELKAAGFAGSIPLHATPEQIVFRVNDLIFSEAVERRKNLRAPVSIPVELILEGQLSEGVIISLSKHGLFLKTARSLPLDSVVDLKFTLPPGSRGGGRRMELTGRVTLVKGRTGPEDIYFGPGMVVIFEEPEISLQGVLDEFVAGELENLRQ